MVQLKLVYRVRWRSRAACLVEVAPLSDDEITSIIASAFKPFSCIVQIRNGAKQVRFKVMNGSAPLHVEFGIGLDTLRDMAHLKSMLTAARAKLEAHGYRLDPY